MWTQNGQALQVFYQDCDGSTYYKHNRDPAIRKLSLVGKPVMVIDIVVRSRKELYSHMKSGSRGS